MASSEGLLSESNRLEDIIIIWLDETIANPGTILLSQRKNLLLSYVKAIQPFTNVSACMKYIENITDVHVLFIVSGSLGEKIVPILHDLPKLTFIYIFCADKNKHEIWTKQFNKIRGVFNDDLLLSIKVKDDVCSLVNINFPFGLFDSTQRSLQELSKEQASFMWFQLVTELLLRLPHTPDSKAEMVTECRSHYKENGVQLEKITIFENTYQACNAIKWYTENTFVFQLFNKAFRMQDFDVIFKYRYFLVDLFSQLAFLYNKQFKDRKGYLTVYRGQRMYREELMKLKHNVGHLISINTFFSASFSCSVAANFSGNGEDLSIGIESVIFDIEVDLTVSCRPFANIDQLSCIKDECEVLFSVGTIFRIDSVELETDAIWLVKLTWTNECSQQLTKMNQLTGLLDFYTGHYIGDHPSVLTFGLFLSKMGCLQQAKRFYINLRKILSTDHPDRGVLHNNLGEIMRKLGYFNQARHHFERAIEYCIDTMSIFHPVWAVIHSNIALLHLTLKRPKHALKCYHCALLIISRFRDPNANQNTYIQESKATVYHGMGSAYILLDQPQKAVGFYQKALEIELKTLPQDHPTLIDTYNELGSVNLRLNEWTKALEKYEESLRIAQHNLLDSDWKLVNLHINVAVLIYFVTGNKSKTLVHCSQALQIMEQSKLPSISCNRMDIYKSLANLYTHIGLGPLAFQMWERFIEEGKGRLVANSDFVNSSDLIKQMELLQLSKETFALDSNIMILFDRNSLFRPRVSQLEAITRCEIADRWRALGHIKPAICYYTWLLENILVSDDPHFAKLHECRLHNNLAACYQDLEDDNAALHHYSLSLEILSSDEENKSIQAAIIHYNIALIYMNGNEFDQTRMHLDKSLLHFLGVPGHRNSTLDVKINYYFAKTYERCNDWKMARDYYQQTIDKCKQYALDESIIDQYEKLLQCMIDKISENTQ
ncbi:unnamed protein product [Rotaria socialis]|uniref:NAD(P)(+)--arginine ADP-ribosyltransferase n=1 Tax=Rotaria socialis TaxID=392032 RepID=A0A820PQ82_9BILA|nr:unnamed protein product [Rotaria socialis]CAF4406603.1 unnamed protein product [Rotaria socialis]